MGKGVVVPSTAKASMNSDPQGANFRAARPLPESATVAARVDSVAFCPNLDAPADRPFPFAYAIALTNGSAQAVTIKARKWVVKNLQTGRCHVVEGDGIGGKFPRLEAGQTFRFNNYHVVAADSVAEGSFLVCDDAGQPQIVRAPAFTMTVPPAV